MGESEQLLKEASSEIKTLQRQNELMAARLDVFDSMMSVLHTQVATRSQGMSPDVAWAIDKHLAGLKMPEDTK